MVTTPPKPKNAFRIELTLTTPRPRIDQVLLEALRDQNQNSSLKKISRIEFKELFKKKRIRIKGQSAVPSSSLAKGTTFVDILGFEETEPEA